MGDEGIAAFAPTRRIVTRAHRHTARRQAAFVPMIEGYVFAQLALVPPVSALKRWHPVVDLVRIGDRPAVIPPRQIEALKALDETDRAPRAGVAVGDRVAALGTAGHVVEVHEREVILLIEFLGRLVKTRAPIEGLDIVEATPCR